jgi:hypothetical protein
MPVTALLPQPSGSLAEKSGVKVGQPHQYGSDLFCIVTAGYVPDVVDLCGWDCSAPTGLFFRVRALTVRYVPEGVRPEV